MDALKAQLLKLQQQLSGLSVSQKMLTASLVAIMIMTILWWARYAGTAEMAPLLEQNLSQADIGRIQQALGGRIKSQIVGGIIMVPADQKMQALAELAYAEALPSNISSAWDEIAKQMSPWDPQSKTDTLMNRAKEQALSAMIGNYFPGVSSANVVINPVAMRMIGGDRSPSATVLIKTRSPLEDKAAGKIASSAASAVASAVSGLLPSKVTVLINGMRRKVQDPNDGSLVGADLYENIEKQEKHYSEEIERFYPGAIVAIRVDLDNISANQTSITFDPKNVIVKPRIEESNTNSTSTPQPTQAEPGAGSNAPLTIGGNAPPQATAATSDVETTKTENTILASQTTENKINPGGKATVLSAAIRVPRSYFVTMFKADNPSETKEPDAGAVQKLFASQKPQIQEHVQRAVAIKSPENISIDMYYDDLTMVAGGKGADAPSGTVGVMLSGHVKEIGVGLLALVSLFMVSSIVKKGTPPPTVIPEPVVKETPRLAFGEDIAGIVGDGAATLDAMEVDDDSIKSQQMVEQVATMVKENPDAAANLVKRWLNK